MVYRVAAHQAVNDAELSAQSDQIKQQLLQSKQGAAFDAFRTALEDRSEEGRETRHQRRRDEAPHSFYVAVTSLKIKVLTNSYSSLAPHSLASLDYLDPQSLPRSQRGSCPEHWG